MRYAVAILFLMLMSSCGPSQAQINGARMARDNWGVCLASQAKECITKYDDSEMCAGLAVADCQMSKNAYVSALTPLMFDGYREALFNANTIESKIKKDLELRLRKLSMDYDKETRKNYSIPLLFQ